jgi:hypothetical protein
MTTDEVKLYLNRNRDASVVFCQLTTEQPAPFLRQSDTRVKVVNIYDTEAFRTVCKVELAGCLDQVLPWIAGIVPNGQSWVNNVTRDLAARIL